MSSHHASHAVHVNEIVSIIEEREIERYVIDTKIVDKFKRYSMTSSRMSTVRGIKYYDLTPEGDYDIRGKLLHNFWDFGNGKICG